MGDVFGVPRAHLSLYLSSAECQDPCRNHKSYREVISKMKPPVIPFVPLILKGESCSRIVPPCPHSSCARSDSRPRPAQL